MFIGCTKKNYTKPTHIFTYQRPLQRDRRYPTFGRRGETSQTPNQVKAYVTFERDDDDRMDVDEERKSDGDDARSATAEVPFEPSGSKN
ncbi:hypothetical protein CFAM422_006928 [Trichoderma lentiforme]|uniref:Uncharacterized protein n=1 Tax=Trichoderma lentiforme TaxID=1567552 RepID=A0A9P4XEN1_9HYPO|nr:hypothetical protein CFAM422_006928 [Trichoderma lentiforme]